MNFVLIVLLGPRANIPPGGLYSRNKVPPLLSSYIVQQKSPTYYLGSHCCQINRCNKFNFRHMPGFAGQVVIFGINGMESIPASAGI